MSSPERKEPPALGHSRAMTSEAAPFPTAVAPFKRRDPAPRRLSTDWGYNTESLMAFLDDLHRHLRHQKAILVWDGLPAHKSRAMQEYVLRQRSWLTVERLPGYAPDLNPIETMWGNIKGKELANRCAQDLAELDVAVRGGMVRVRRSRTLPFSFLKHAGLSF